MLKNILIIGYGKIGKRYLSILKKKKVGKITVLKNKIISSKKINFIYDLKDIKQISGVIIASPTNTHFKYAKFFLKKKIPILLEKPICQNLFQAQILKKLSIKNKSSLIINYSDLFDPNFIKLIKLFNLDLGTIQTLAMKYGNNKNKYYYKKTITPSQDWLPHPISIIVHLLDKIKDFQIINYKYKIDKNNQIFESFTIKFFKQKINIVLDFSNFIKSFMRSVHLKSKNSVINFDAYNDNNYFIKKKKIIVSYKKNSFENVTEFFLKNIDKNLYFTNIGLGLKEMKITSSILQKIMYLRKK